MSRMLRLLALVLVSVTPVRAQQSSDLPLPAERAISFPVTSGTWMSLDVHPSGEYLVFDLLGDLYTLPIEGGEAQLLLGGPAVEVQPRFSPDGSRIAFVSDRSGMTNLWVMDADGTNLERISSVSNDEFTSPEWTPDGRYVVVTRDRTLWSYALDGGGGLRLMDTREASTTDALGPAVTPDGRVLYHARHEGGYGPNAVVPTWQLAERDFETGQVRVVTNEPGGALRPRVSPDGRSLVYASRLDGRTTLRLRDLGSGTERWLGGPIQQDDQEMWTGGYGLDLLPGYAFTPDGSTLVAAYDGTFWRIDIRTGDRERIAFRALVDQRVADLLRMPTRVGLGPVKARVIQHPALSPDGSRIAFTAFTSLFVTPSTGPSRELSRTDAVAENAYQPAWSPDGNSLVWVTWEEDGGHLWRLDGPDGAPRRLTDSPGYYASPRWSPDGTRVVMMRSSARTRLLDVQDDDLRTDPAIGSELVWIPSDGGPPTRITARTGLRDPHFGGSSDRIYATDGGTLVSMRWDGSDHREHITIRGPGRSGGSAAATDLLVSPRGTEVAAKVNGDAYLVDLPRLGTGLLELDIRSPAVPMIPLGSTGADYLSWRDDGAEVVWSIGSTIFRTEVAAPVDYRESEHFDSISVTVEWPRSLPDRPLALIGARLITMEGDEVIERGTVVIEDGRIAMVGRDHEVTVPPNAKRIDVSGTTMLPGFIDTHAHWREIRRHVLQTPTWSLAANLAYGVTTGLDPQARSQDSFVYADLVAAGAVEGPRMLSVGRGIFSDQAWRFDSVVDGRRFLRRYADRYGTPHVKAYVTGRVANRELRQSLAMAAAEEGVMPTTEGVGDYKLNLTHIIDGFRGIEHNLSPRPMQADLVGLMARSGISYTPTLLVLYGGPSAEGYYLTREPPASDRKVRRFLPPQVIDRATRGVPFFPDSDQRFDDYARDVTRLVRAGARVGVGSHGQLQGISFHWELRAMAAGGLDPLEILRVATLGGAEVLAVDQDLGSISVGKIADLVVLDSNPLDDLRATTDLRFVIRQGRVMDAETLGEVWPNPRPGPSFWWHDRDGATAEQSGS